jgi:hypothetical protein
MTDYELIVRSSIQVFLANPQYLKPEVFGSCCLISYQDRLFFISVSHVTDFEGLATLMETTLPFDERGPILKTVGGICYFDLINMKKDLISVEEFEKVLQTGKRLDISFAEIKDPVTLLQPEMDFGAFKVHANNKAILHMDEIAEPQKEERYGFYGKVKPEYFGKGLKMTSTLKHNLKFHRTNKDFHIFLAPEVIKDSLDYEGCSGAPILDSNGKLVALACAIRTGTRIIYGFPITEGKKLLDYALQMGML